jgi:hypothetical protein
LIATGFEQSRDFFETAIRPPREPRPMREPERDRAYRPAAPSVSAPVRTASTGTSPAAPFAEDDWVAESSIIKFLRER